MFYDIFSQPHFSYFLPLVLCLLSTLLLRSISSLQNKNKNNATLNLPPSPPSIPLLGHLHHLFSSHLYKSFHTLSSQYGPLLYLRLGSSKTLLVSSPALAAQVFKTQDLSFSSRPTFYFADKILYGDSGFINAPYGEYWRFMKKLCVTELLGAHQVARSHHIRVDELHKYLKLMIQGAKTLEEVDVGAMLVNLTNNVVCRMTMSTSCSVDEDEATMARGLVKESFELAGKLYIGEMVGPLKGLVLWLYGKRAQEMTKRFDGLLERILRKHEEKLVKEDCPKDLMDIVLEVYRDENAKVKITRDNIKSFFIDLIIAGTDTSSQAMQWALAELTSHPSCLTTLQQEIHRAVGSNPRLIRESDSPNLPYLHAVINETLRLHPPGPITTRLSRHACELDGRHVPASTPVAVNLYSIMRDPAAWDDPDEFRPERFLGLDAARLGSGVAQLGSGAARLGPGRGGAAEFVPFGAGRRGCPGTQLAYVLMAVVLAATVQCFEWRRPEEGVEMKVRGGLSLGMASSLKCRPVVRFDPFEFES